MERDDEKANLSKEALPMGSDKVTDEAKIRFTPETFVEQNTG